MEPMTFSQKYRDELLAEISSVIGDGKLPLYGMMRYQLGWVDEQGKPQPGWGGKMLRSALCLLTCELVGGDWRKALPAAASLEMVHNFSLIHDDIEDGSPQRRHRDALWKVWGQAQAINTGDAMFALARLAMLRLATRGVPDTKVLRAVSRLDETCLQLTTGQYLDISYEQRLDIGVKQYLDMISGKTASLFACSFYLGALVACDNEPVITHLDNFGRKLGMVFQIQDDILNIWGDGSVTGKPSAWDIHHKKKSLPIIYALEKSSGKQRDIVLAVYQKQRLDDADVAAVVSILDLLDTRSYVQKLARDYHKQAVEELKASNLKPEVVQRLLQVAEPLIGRTH
jgi:geranylgeranyl diphosphate synthase, type I